MRVTKQRISNLAEQYLTHFIVEKPAVASQKLIQKIADFVGDCREYDFGQRGRDSASN